MIWNKRDNIIDASAMLDERDRGLGAGGDGDGDRGMADLGGRPKSVPGAKPFLLVTGAAVAALAVAFTVQAVSKKGESEAKPAAERQVKNLKPGFQPAALTSPVVEAAPEEEGDALDLEDGAVPLAPAAVGRPRASGWGEAPLSSVPALEASPGAMATAPSGPPQPSPAELVLMRRLQTGFGAPGRRAGQSASPAPVAEVGQQGSGGALEAALRPMQLKGEKAGTVGNRDMILTQGAMLDCVLETRLVSTVPGMASCHLTRDVYSTNGRVVVLDRGSKVVGFYQGGMRQGQSRIFVQWARVETPKGVVINLASPGTGPLGEGGLDGWIDTHFRERFGGAILLSMIDDLGDYFANRNRGSGGQLQLNNTGDVSQELARTSLQNSINIPPTLYKNQGERIAIFVARDLDFSGVYDLVRN